MMNEKIAKLEEDLKSTHGEKKVELLHTLAFAMHRISTNKAKQYAEEAMGLAVKLKDKEGVTPMQRAALKGHLDVVELLK